VEKVKVEKKNLTKPLLIETQRKTGAGRFTNVVFTLDTRIPVPDVSNKFEGEVR
jgi:hypothetical protein